MVVSVRVTVTVTLTLTLTLTLALTLTPPCATEPHACAITSDAGSGTAHSAWLG